MTTSDPSLDVLRAVPKVLLHDHLDGGLRPTTVIELAREVDHTLPTTDAGELARMPRGVPARRIADPPRVRFRTPGWRAEARPSRA